MTVGTVRTVGTAGRPMPTHLLTIAVEDYFHVAALRRAVQRKHWERLPSHVERNLEVVLALLERHGARATFFVFGVIAERQPEIVRAIVARGHEVASRGYWPRDLEGMSEADFVEDARRARDALEAAGSGPIVGYRAPAWLREQDAWMLDVLAREGYAYDSSINPVLRRFAGDPEKFRIHRHGGMWEFPISTVGAMGLRVAISGGNYIRQIPHTLLKQAVAQKSRQEEPLVFYFMPWELDRDQPDIQGISPVQRLRHYRNLGKARWVMRDYFKRYRFIGIAEHLGLARELPAAACTGIAAPAPAAPAIALAPAAPEPLPAGAPVTLVVPIFNEEKTVGYLRRTLIDLRRDFAGRYQVHLVLVDDCSTDDTAARLASTFADVPGCTIVRHEQNRGVAAAILTGIRAAPTEIVCSIDCDLSYDPSELARMLPLIADADLVTASPYHPDGRVFNVPAWRLFLSRGLSLLYSGLLREQIHTYTSCCRVYRRSAILPLRVQNGGFVGLAETVIELHRAGGRIAEHPATLESRLLGESKMKVARTIAKHLGLVQELVMGGRAAHAGATAPPDGRKDP